MGLIIFGLLFAAVAFYHVVDVLGKWKVLFITAPIVAIASQNPDTGSFYLEGFFAGLYMCLFMFAILIRGLKWFGIGVYVGSGKASEHIERYW